MTAAAAKNRPAFYIIALLLPVLLLALVECGLRLAGFGHHYPLFVQSTLYPDYSEPNQQLIKRYFPYGNAPAVSPDTVLFKTQKPADSFRIVILGESSAAGFPYGRWGSLQGMLEQRVKRTYPHKNIEIINTAMAAINSYTLLDFTDEILAIEPDLVLIYAGHNEYLGILGVGSTFAAKGGRASTLAYLYVKDVKLYQLLESVYYRLSRNNPSEATESRRSLMSRVAQGQHIPYQSTLYQEGIAQFSANLQQLIKRYTARNIPLLLGNLVSNEADLVPFSALAAADWPAITADLARGTTPQLPASAQHNPAAQAYFAGLVARQQGNTDAARQHFSQARDHDELRFRAPTAFNLLLNELATQPGVTLVDVHSLFTANSLAGLIGHSLLLEHVHPNNYGYFLLAEAFYQAIEQSGVLGKPLRYVSTEQAWADNPVSELDEQYARLKITQLQNDYPFTLTPQPLPQLKIQTEADQLLLRRLQGEDWLVLQQALLSHYQQTQQLAKAAKVAGVLADAMPQNHQAFSVAGALYLQLDDIVLADYFHSRAAALQPQTARYLLNLAQTRFMLADYQTSLTLLRQARSLEPDNPQIPFFMLRVRAAAGEAANE